MVAEGIHNTQDGYLGRAVTVTQGRVTQDVTRGCFTPSIPVLSAVDACMTSSLP